MYMCTYTCICTLVYTYMHVHVIHVHSACTISFPCSVLSVYKVLDVLLAKNKITQNDAERVRGFLKGTTPHSPKLTTPIPSKKIVKVYTILHCHKILLRRD